MAVAAELVNLDARAPVFWELDHVPTLIAALARTADPEPGVMGAIATVALPERTLVLVHLLALSAQPDPILDLGQPRAAHARFAISKRRPQARATPGRRRTPSCAAAMRATGATA